MKFAILKTAAVLVLLAGAAHAEKTADTGKIGSDLSNLSTTAAIAPVDLSIKGIVISDIGPLEASGAGILAPDATAVGKIGNTVKPVIRGASFKGKAPAGKPVKVPGSHGPSKPKPIDPLAGGKPHP